MNQLTIEKNKLVKMPQGSSCYVKIKNSALIVFHKLESQESYYLCLSDIPQNKALVILNEAAKKFNSDAYQLQVKYMSSDLYFTNVEQNFSKCKVFKGKTIGFDDEVEAFIFSKEGRIKISVNKHKNKLSIQEFSNQNPIKVMVIDDSKTIRNIIKRALSEFDDIDVVGETGMPSEAYDLIKSLKPDVLTLDINMPEMSGVELLKFLKTKHNVQVPAIIVSSMSMSEGTSVLEALENGGVDYIQKPSLDEVDSLGATLKAKLEMAYLQSKKSTLKVVKTFDKSLSGSFNSFDGLLAIGASTGGTEAIKNVLLGLPEEIPPIVIVQHIPPFFSKAFAQRLNEVCPHYDISEAVDGDILVKNKILIAPGDYQLEVENSKGNYVVKVYKGEKVSGHCPSVDVMFHSVAKLKSNRVGVILTGMGADGAKGLLAMKETGAYTISQDEESSVVYGMPKVAANIGASYEQTSLHKIPQSMCVKYNQSLKKSKVA